jgi:hypothetical protein
LIGPHIDPLGIPTQLASVMFRPHSQVPACNATLWGFLKKFIFTGYGNQTQWVTEKLITPQPTQEVIAPQPTNTGGLCSTTHKAQTHGICCKYSCVCLLLPPQGAGRFCNQQLGIQLKKDLKNSRCKSRLLLLFATKGPIGEHNWLFLYKEVLVGWPNLLLHAT